MPAIFSALSIEQQTERYNHIKRMSPVPYTYKIATTMDNTIFSGSSATFGGLLVNTFTAPNALALVATQVSVTSFLADATSLLGCIISYLNRDTLVQNGALSAPNDAGNDIFWLTWSGSTPVYNYQRYYPYGYFLAANQPLYIMFGADAGTLAAGNVLLKAQVVLHTLQTGRQN